MNQFSHPVDHIEPPAEALEDLVAQLGRVLTPVFTFIAKGRLTKTMEMRSWVVIRAVRKDLIHEESLDDAAKRFGISAQRLHVLVKEFRACVPDYCEPDRKPESQRKRMRDSYRRTHSPAPPRGKESFSTGVTSAGSAST